MFPRRRIVFLALRALVMVVVCAAQCLTQLPVFAELPTFAQLPDLANEPSSPLDYVYFFDPYSDKIPFPPPYASKPWNESDRKVVQSLLDSIYSRAPGLFSLSGSAGKIALCRTSEIPSRSNVLNQSRAYASASFAVVYIADRFSRGPNDHSSTN